MPGRCDVAACPEVFICLTAYTAIAAAMAVKAAWTDVPAAVIAPTATTAMSATSSVVLEQVLSLFVAVDRVDEVHQCSHLILLNCTPPQGRCERAARFTPRFPVACCGLAASAAANRAS